MDKIEPTHADPSLSRAKLFALIVLIGFLGASLFDFVQGNLRGLGYPRNTYLFSPNDTLADFRYGATTMLAHLDPFHTEYRGQGPNYPPFAYLFIAPLTFFGGLWGSLIYIVLSSAGILFFVWKAVFNKDVPAIDRLLLSLIIACLSYPTHFALDRLNTENLIFFSCAGFYLAFNSNRYKLSAALLAAGTAAKIYPALFAVMLLRRKRFFETFLLLLWTIFFTVVALVIFRTDIPSLIAAYKHSSTQFDSDFLSTHALQHATSLYALVRWIQIACLGSNALAKELTTWTLKFCSILSLSLFVVMLIALSRERLEEWGQWLLITICILIVPQISFDYKLLLLYLPLASLINSGARGRQGLYFTILLALVFVPKSYGILVDDVTTNVLLNASLLLAMGIMLIERAFRVSPDSTAHRPDRCPA